MENTIDNAREFITAQAQEDSPNGRMFANIRRRYGDLLLGEAMVAYAASVKPDGYRVKPLEWRRPKNTSVEQYVSDTVFGAPDYIITLHNGRWTTDRFDDAAPTFDTLDLAKAAAEADYLERIGKALEPC